VGLGHSDRDGIAGRLRSFGLALTLALLAAAAAGGGVDWSPFAEAYVIRIVTRDADGAERDTRVWFVVVGGDGFVRTNDSRWLANIRRGSPVALRLDHEGRTMERAVSAEEVNDATISAVVEEAYKAKYGFVQRVMSFLRLREPAVLRLREDRRSHKNRYDAGLGGRRRHANCRSPPTRESAWG
jgi:hypothetical protein